MSHEPYQVMPPLAGAEYEALKASIAAGYDPARPVVVDENGTILDGHHRQQVCAELGITPPTITLPGLTEDQKHDYALRTNLACRHLTQLQKRALIGAELDRDPTRSDREIGRLCGVDHKTVGAVRGGEIPHPPAVTREEAEHITRQIRKQLEDLDLELTGALVQGVPVASLAAGFTGLFRKFEAEHDDRQVIGLVRELLFDPRLDAILGWPRTGAYAEMWHAATRED